MVTTKKRAAVIVTEYLSSGGLRTWADYLLRVLADIEGLEVKVISLAMSHSAPESQRLLKPFTWIGPRTSVRSVSGDHLVQVVGSRWAEFEFMRYTPRAPLDLALSKVDLTFVVGGTPAACNVVGSFPGPVMLLTASLIGEERTAVISSKRGFSRLWLRMMTSITSRFDRRGLARADSTIVLNEWMRGSVRELGAKHVHLEAPGIDTGLYHVMEEWSERAGYLLMVGRLGDPRKNVRQLVLAYARARELGVTRDLVLAGKTGPGPEVLALIELLHLSRHVRVLVDVPELDLPDLYRNAAAFALPSSEEGLGIVLLEAMASGVAIISTATAGASFALGASECGSLVALDHLLVENFATELVRYLGNDSLALSAGLKGRQRVLELFSSAASATRLRDIVMVEMMGDSAVS